MNPLKFLLVPAMLTGSLSVALAENLVFMNADPEGRSAELIFNGGPESFFIQGHSTLGPVNLPAGSREVELKMGGKLTKTKFQVPSQKSAACVIQFHDKGPELTVFDLETGPGDTSVLTGVALDKAHGLQINGDEVQALPGKPAVWKEWDKKALSVKTADGDFLYGVAAEDAGSSIFMAIYADKDGRLHSQTFVHGSNPSAASTKEPDEEEEMAESISEAAPPPPAAFDGVPIPATEMDKIKSFEGQIIEITGELVRAGESKSGKTRYLNFTERGKSISAAISAGVAGETFSMEALGALQGKQLLIRGKVETDNDSTLVRIQSTEDIKIQPAAGSEAPATPPPPTEDSEAEPVEQDAAL